MIDPTDILAVVLMVLFVVRRTEIRATEARAFPGVDPAQFAAWQASAIRARSLAVNACFAKAFLNAVWFYGARTLVPASTLRIGGLVLFGAWFAAMGYAGWRYAAAKKMGDRLGIVIGRRLV